MMFYAQRLFFLLPALWAALAAAAQPTLQAEYTPFYADRNASENVVEYGGYCSFYCLLSPDTVYASSALSDGTSTYGVENAFDFDSTTAWADGVQGLGEGETITFELDVRHIVINRSASGAKDEAITEIELINGYYKNENVWRANGRVKQMGLFVNGQLHCFIDWLDKRDLQTAKIPHIYFPDLPRMILRFVIMDVYPGEKYEDVCITELEYDGIGDH